MKDIDLDLPVQIENECSLHHFRTEIPNIVFQMDLDPAEFKTYCVLKKTAGDKGSCFKSTNTLCKEVGIGITKFKECQKKLQEKKLIRVQRRKHSNGGSYTNLITIIDIWPLNMKTIMQERSPQNLERGGVAERRGGGRQTTEGGSPNDTKEEHKEEEPKEQQQHAAASFSSSKEKTVLKYQTDQGKNSKIYPELKKIDIPESDKIEISRRYSQEIIRKAIEWSIHPKTKINTTLAQALKWACQNQPELPREKNDIIKENRNLCKKLDGLKNEFAEVTVLQNCIEFSYRGQKASSVIAFSENGFKNQLDSLMRKCKFL